MSATHSPARERRSVDKLGPLATRAAAARQLAGILAAIDQPRPIPALHRERAERCGCHGAWSPDGRCPLPTRTENP